MSDLMDHERETLGGWEGQMEEKGGNDTRNEERET